MPVKIAFDVLGHFAEHGKLTFDDLPQETP